MATLMNNLLHDSGDEQRLHDLAHNDEADRRFDTDLHRVACKDCPGPDANEGRDCECDRLATIAALRGAWAWMRNTVLSLTVSDWLAIACLAAVIGSFWTH